MTAKKKAEVIKYFLPTGGEIEIESTKSKKDVLAICQEIDPAVENANLVDNGDGTMTFVRTAGTKAMGQRDKVKADSMALIAEVKELILRKECKNRKTRIVKVLKDLMKLQ